MSRFSSQNNSSQRELRPPVPRIVLRMKQVNFKARLHDLINRLVNRAAAGVRGSSFTQGLFLTAQP